MELPLTSISTRHEEMSAPAVSATVRRLLADNSGWLHGWVRICRARNLLREKRGGGNDGKESRR